MLVYSASIVFYAGSSWLSAYPGLATDQRHESVDSFLDSCELNARAHPMFATSDVCINAMICRVDEDGTVHREGVQPKMRCFRNYKG